MIHLDEAQDRELVRAALLHYACLCRGSEVAAILSDDLEAETLHRERRLRADMLRAALLPDVPDSDGPPDDYMSESEARYYADLGEAAEARQREASGW